MKKKSHFYSLCLEDLLLIVAIAVFSFGLLLSNFGVTKSHEALIYQNNLLVQTINLQKAQFIHLKNLVIEVNEGKIRVKEASCPEQICVHTGWISQAGQIIVCIPNHLLIQIEGQAEGKYQGYVK